MTVLVQPLADYRTRDLPSQIGFQAWTYPPPKIADSNPVPGSGALSLHLIKIPVPMTITQAAIDIRAAAGSAQANTYLCVYNLAGALLGQSADVSAAWQSTGMQQATLTPVVSGSLTLPTGAVYAGFLVGTNAGTVANLGNRSQSKASIANLGLLNSTGVQATGTLMRTFQLTGQGTTVPTTIAAAISAGGLSPSRSFWVGLS